VYLHSGDVTDPLFLEHEFFDPRDIVQVKYEMLRRLRMEGMSVTDAARAFGFSRVTFYQILKRFEEGGLGGLLPMPRGPRRAHKFSEEVMEFVEQALAREPSLRALLLAEMIEEHFGFSVHPRSIERALAQRQKKRKG
jgi:transposase